jgi:tRNA(adenine34) deaminase
VVMDRGTLRTDEFYMKAALREAERARKRGEVPVGAVVVSRGRIVARGSNRPVSASDPTAHAEIIALRRAARRVRNYRLPGCDLYVTLEPCPMCLGAVVHSRLRRLVYGASDPKFGSVRSIMVFPFTKSNHRPQVAGGVLAEDCGRILREFFGRRRA